MTIGGLVCRPIPIRDRLDGILYAAYNQRIAYLDIYAGLNKGLKDYVIGFEHQALANLWVNRVKRCATEAGNVRRRASTLAAAHIGRALCGGRDNSHAGEAARGHFLSFLMLSTTCDSRSL